MEKGSPRDSRFAAAGRLRGMTAITIVPIDPTVLRQVRTTGIDALGRPAEWFIDHAGGNQVRCCLTTSRPGERVGLISHRPLEGNRPWAEVGPVYVHGDTCPASESDTPVPDWLDASPRVLRSYDASGAMIYAANRIVDSGEGVEAALEDILSDPMITEVHIRNLVEQCFIAKAVRAE